MRRIRSALVTALATVGMLVTGLAVSPPASAAPGDPVVSTGVAVSGLVNAQIPITSLSVTGTGTVPVRLRVTSGTLSMTTTTGLTFTGSSTGSTVQFSGDVADVNTALATLRYTRGSTGTDTVEVALVEPGVVFNPDNGHLYEYVSDTLTWTAARDAAAARTRYGATGYLATVTSSGEQAFITPRISGASWFGAGDMAVEGTWRWVTGPENGQLLSYTNWNSMEPNDSGGNEDCAQFLLGSGQTGQWNDLPCSGTTVDGYVVEYGTSGTLPDVSETTVPVTVQTTQTIGSITNTGSFAQWGGTMTVAATATSGLSVTFSSSTPSVCTVSGATVSLLAVGTCTIAADQAGNTTYTAAAQVTRDFTVGARSQTISFTAPTGVLIGDTPTLVATATSGLTVDFASTTPSVCTVSSTTLTALAEGDCTIDATQAGDGEWSAASTAQRTFAITEALALTGGGGTVTGVASTPTVIDDLVVAGSGTVPVRLRVASGTLSMSTTTGLTFTGASSGSTLQFSGTRANVNAALATLTYTRGSGGTDTLEASLVDPGLVFNPDNGHIYEYVSGQMSWNDARTAAAARTRLGVSGYLATVTSAEEQAFITPRLSGAAWFGASDSAVEGTWRWVTGPEDGDPLGYTNWNAGEPNNAGNEDCAQFLLGSGMNGQWNDLPCASSLPGVPGYVVEYGAPGNVPTVAATTIGITTLATQTIGSITSTGSFAEWGGSFTVAATASSGLPVVFTTSTPSVCTVSGATVTLLGVGTCTILADQAGDGSSAAAPQQTRDFTIGQRDQNLDVTVPGTQGVGATVTMAHTSTSGFPVTFASTTPSVCTVDGDEVTTIAGGTCTITATNAGDGEWQSATDTVTFTVDFSTQVITFTPPTGAMRGTPLQLTASTPAPGTVTFTSTTPSVCTVTGTTLTPIAAGTCTIVVGHPGTVVYDPVSVTHSFDVARTAQSILFPTVTGTTYPVTVTMTAATASGLSVTYASLTPRCAR
jgi:hypothetical protein